MAGTPKKITASSKTDVAIDGRCARESKGDDLLTQLAGDSSVATSFGIRERERERERREEETR